MYPPETPARATDHRACAAKRRSNLSNAASASCGLSIRFAAGKTIVVTTDNPPIQCTTERMCTVRASVGQSNVNISFDPHVLGGSAPFSPKQGREQNCKSHEAEHPRDRRNAQQRHLPFRFDRCANPCNCSDEYGQKQ